MLVAAVATVPCNFFLGWLSDRVARKEPVVACLFLSGIAVLLIPLQESPAGFMGFMAYYDLATGIQSSMAAWPTDVVLKGKLDTSTGVYPVIADIGMMLGPITATYIDTGDESVTFMSFPALAILVLVVGVLMIWARDQASRRHAEEHTVDCHNLP